MTKNRKDICFLIILMFLIVLMGCEKKIQVEKEPELIKERVITQENSVKRTYISELKAVVTKEQFVKKSSEKDNLVNSYSYSIPKVSPNYLVYEESKKLLTYPKKNWGDTIVEVDYFYLNVYSTQENFSFLKKIDIKQLIQRYNSQYLPYLTYSSITKIDGKDYIGVNIYHKGKKTYGYTEIYISLEDEAIIESFDKNKIVRYRENKSQFYIINNTVTSLSNKIQSDFANNTQILYRDSVEFENKLMKTQPQISSYFKLNSNEVTYVNFPDESVPTETIINYLLPEGESMYDGLVLYGEYSKDGKDHEIHSMEEFLEWYQEDRNE